ncbi:hypothetical protein DYB26_015423, partial [Aphanomyces astaci]
KVRIGPLPTLTTPADILAALHGSQLPSPDVDIIDDYATLTFDSPSPAAFLWNASGPHGTTRLYVRNIAVQLHVLMGRPRTTAVAMQCSDCGRLDHQGKPCDRFTYLDPRDRTRSASRHNSTTRGTKSPGARSRSKSVHTRAGRLVSQHSATVSHTPQSWQYPPQQQPLHASGPTTDLVPHLRRELSTYVDHRIVQATAPLQQEVDTLRADKEALTALVSATSAAFTTLDARLLEERRLREAAEHQQSKDQRKLTEAQNRLQTTITQQGTHQAAMAERLPIIESTDDLHQTAPNAPPTTTTEPRQRRRRRSWRIQRLPLPTPDMNTARIQLDNVLRRETLESEAYIGDVGTPPTPDPRVDSLRIATTNINKNTYGKLRAELATWFRANALDFLIIADADLPAHKATQLWTPSPGGAHTPSLMAISNHRAL